MVEEGAVGKLSRIIIIIIIIRRESCRIAADTTPPPPLPTQLLYHSLFGDEPLREVTQGVGGVCRCGTAWHFDIFYLNYK